MIPYCAGQVFSSDTAIRASRPYPRGPRSGQGCSVPVHQHLLTSSEPLACTPRFPGIRWLYGEPLLCGSAWAAHEWFRAFTAHPCQHAALYDHGEPAGCLYPVPSPAAQPSSSEERFGILIHPTTVRYRWDPLFAANGSLLLLQPADLLVPLTDPTPLALCRLGRLLRSLVREIALSSVRYDYSSNWASSTGRYFPCWINS